MFSKSVSVVLSGALLLTLGGVAGCKKTLKPASVESSIKGLFEKNTGLKLKGVTCPKDKEAKAANNFECTGEIDDGGKMTIAVVQNDDKGSLLFSLKGVIVKQAELTENLTKTLGGKTEAKCPKAITILRKGETTSCTYDGAGKGKVDITPTDDEKDFKFAVTKDGAAAAEAPVAAGHKEDAPPAPVVAEEE